MISSCASIMWHIRLSADTHEHVCATFSDLNNLDEEIISNARDMLWRYCIMNNDWQIIKWNSKYFKNTILPHNSKIIELRLYVPVDRSDGVPPVPQDQKDGVLPVRGRDVTRQSCRGPSWCHDLDYRAWCGGGVEIRNRNRQTWTIVAWWRERGGH